MAKAPQRQEEMAELLQNKMYDTSIIRELEAYVDEQVKTCTYDFTANRHLLQLYNLLPQDGGKKMTDVLDQVLLLSLAQLPVPHFTACVCLVQGKMQKEDNVRRLVQLHGVLESGDFAKFWNELNEPKTRTLVSQLPNFHDQMRRFVASSVADVYQVIPVSQLKEYLNYNDETKLSSFVKSLGWTIDPSGSSANKGSKKKGKGSRKKGSRKKNSRKKGGNTAASAPRCVTIPLGTSNQFHAVSVTEKLSLDTIATVLENIRV